ncbi:MAG: DeoR family transcriptional regulator [Candidatus Staskawiczbacteria bacterium]|nr:DeoR family transcriptional regulator [Candidatus Staskawiczbacteria bacterium]
MEEAHFEQSFLEISKNRLSNGVKLTNTVYKVLDFFPESDPLKNRAKDKALAIMENLILINETSGWMSFQKEKLKAQLLEDINILLGYLWIGKTQGWLNSSNCLIISNEYEKIKKSAQNSLLANNVADPQQSRPKASLGGETTQPKQQIEPVLNNTEHKTPNFSLSSRHQKILEFLENNNKAQVMDLQKVLPDITKRTIRRDLDELLGADKIVRSGDFNQVFYQIKQ